MIHLKAFQIVAVLFSLTETLSASVFCPDEVYENEEEALNAFDSGLIERYELEALMALIKHPVELNGAGTEQLGTLPCLNGDLIEKIEAHRKNIGFLKKEDLLDIEGITVAIYRAIEPFITVSPRQGKPEVAGSGGAILAAGGEKRPEGYLRSEADIVDFIFNGLSLSAGALFTAAPAYAAKGFRIDGDSAVYVVTRSGFKPSFEKFHLSVSYDGFTLLAGSFTAGAGEGLVFNNAGRGITGIRPDSSISFNTGNGGLYRYDNFFGLALSASADFDRQISLDAFAFVSRIKKDLYQYYAENVDFLLEGGDNLEFAVISDFITEKTAGGSVSMSFYDTFIISFSGYALSADIPCGGCEARFSKWSKYPQGGKSAAAGIRGGILLKDISIKGEYARSFTPNDDYGSGAAWIVAGEADFHNFSAAVGYRRLGTGFINPLSSVYSSPDLFEGDRARDETGAFLKGSLGISQVVLNELFLDFHRHPSTGGIDAEGKLAIRFNLPWKVKIRPFFGFKKEDDGSGMYETGLFTKVILSGRHLFSIGFSYKIKREEEAADVCGFFLNLKFRPFDALQTWVRTGYYLSSSNGEWSADHYYVSTGVKATFWKIMETSFSYKFDRDFLVNSDRSSHTFWWRFGVFLT